MQRYRASYHTVLIRMALNGSCILLEYYRTIVLPEYESLLDTSFKFRTLGTNVINKRNKVNGKHLKFMGKWRET